MKLLETKINRLILLTIVAVAMIVGIVASKSDNPTSVLWEVRPKSDTSKVAYLLGSVHFAIPEMYPLHPVIMDAWKKCNALAVEINVLDFDMSSITDFMSTEELTMTFFSLIMKIVNITGKLSNQLPDDLYQKTKVALLKSGIPEEYIDMLTPLGAALVLQLGDVSKFLFNKDSSAVDGIDTYFLKQATDQDIPIYELESVELQVKMLMLILDVVLETIDDNPIPYLQAQLDKMDSSDTGLDELFTAWKNGDIKTLENIINTPHSTDKRLNDKIMNALMYDRNIDMAKKIEEYLKSKEKFFIVVGAGHYVGEKSIIDILQKTGKYHIKRL